MTAEFAVLLPAVVVMLAMVLAAASAGVAKLRCIDAARSAARLAARHEPEAAVATAHSAAPGGASVGLSITGDLVRVRVNARIPLPLPGRPRIEVGARAVALLEQDAAPGEEALDG